ncbi:hypothetical protein GCM10010102_09380 [Promicromonospora citrea]|uniref:Uncharacterized protein n=1 Tax=Promicromonospora citrea TaxID=43677 RepID=A0A8H9GFG5_9MICO|nr:hypothetical protein GCM10010102_09380 [Promicromonospora citrea]
MADMVTRATDSPPGGKAFPREFHHKTVCDLIVTFAEEAGTVGLAFQQREAQVRTPSPVTGPGS